MKKLMPLLAVMVFLCISILGVSVLPMLASAETQGRCGRNLIWTLDNNGVLTISREGWNITTSEMAYNITTSEAAYDNRMYDYYPNSVNRSPWGTGITKVIIEDGVTSIGNYAFDNCTNLTSITIPDSVSSIGYSTFYGCTSLTSINIPDSVSSIGGYAFSGCTSLTSITIPDSVTSIGDYAFEFCRNLTKVLISGIDTTFGDNIFDSSAIRPTIYCYEFSDADYWAAENGYDVKYLDTLNWDEERTITLLPKNVRVALGSTRQLAANVFPNDDHPTVTWSSSNPAVATVDGTGTVTAVGKGEAVITAAVGGAAVGGAVIGGAVLGASDSAAVTVYVPAESFELPAEIWVVAKTTAAIPVTQQPADAVFTWTSADESYATVDENGVVTGRKPGDTTVTATADNGLSRACTVHVCYPVTAIEFSQAALTLGNFQTAQLTATVTARTQTFVNRLVTFASSDETVATVDENGLVTAHGAGAATVTATASNGVAASCSVTVRVPTRLTLPAELTAIESEAFAGLDSADVIVIPASVASIAEDAFNSTGAVLAVTPGSPAEQFCVDHGLDYIDVGDLD